MKVNWAIKDFGITSSVCQENMEKLMKMEDGRFSQPKKLSLQRAPTSSYKGTSTYIYTIISYNMHIPLQWNHIPTRDFFALLVGGIKLFCAVWSGAAKGARRWFLLVTLGWGFVPTSFSKKEIINQIRNVDFLWDIMYMLYIYIILIYIYIY